MMIDGEEYPSAIPVNGIRMQELAQAIKGRQAIKQDQLEEAACHHVESIHCWKIFLEMIGYEYRAAFSVWAIKEDAIKVPEQIEARLRELEADERLQYPVAKVSINAPLALEQIGRKSMCGALRWVLGLPPGEYHKGS